MLKYSIIATLLRFSDVNECNTGGHNCHSEAKCNNTIGSFNCTCNEGYSGDGRSCAGIYGH